MKHFRWNLRNPCRFWLCFSLRFSTPAWVHHADIHWRDAGNWIITTVAVQHIMSLFRHTHDTKCHNLGSLRDGVLPYRSDIQKSSAQGAFLVDWNARIFVFRELREGNKIAPQGFAWVLKEGNTVQGIWKSFFSFGNRHGMVPTANALMSHHHFFPARKYFFTDTP